MDTALAMALTCGILLIIANLTPVLAIRVAGTQTEVNLWEAALSLETGWISLSALVLLATMLVIPAMQIASIVWLMGFARARRRVPGFARILALLHVLSEVFLLGALVAIVKLSNFLPIDVGSGIWALALLTAFIAGLGRFDPGSWWRLQPSDMP
jgi:paraquat-inducible protein A